MKKKTILDVMHLLDPLYKREGAIVIKETDYKWVVKVLKGKVVKDEIVFYKDKPIHIETVKTKMKPAKLSCNGCGKSSGKIKFYIIADDLEKPRPYHKKCIDELHMKVLMNLSGIK